MCSLFFHRERAVCLSINGGIPEGKKTTFCSCSQKSFTTQKQARPGWFSCDALYRNSTSLSYECITYLMWTEQDLSWIAHWYVVRVASPCVVEAAMVLTSRARGITRRPLKDIGGPEDILWMGCRTKYSYISTQHLAAGLHIAWETLTGRGGTRLECIRTSCPSAPMDAATYCLPASPLPDNFQIDSELIIMDQ